MDKLNTLASTVDICNNEPYILLQNELESIRKEYIKGLFVGTRAKWIEEGEKPTKYFLSLERRKYINKTLTRIIDNNGNTITNQMEIFYEIKAYNRHLYDNKDSELHNVNLDLIINKCLVNTLDKEMREELEGEILYIEAVEAFKEQKKNDKSPGPDGFTSEFLNCFWKDIGYFWLKSVNEAFKKGLLSTSQKLGIISILLKADKSREFLKKKIGDLFRF